MPRVTPPATTRLVLPVPEIHATVPGAHIELLAPFLDADAIDEGVLVELRSYFADLAPFVYVLGEPVVFPGGRRYLPPQPVGVFRKITHTLRRSFPELIGPATALDSVVPHLFLPDAVAVPTPLEVHAREAHLVTVASDRPLATFDFGTTAA